MLTRRANERIVEYRAVNPGPGGDAGITRRRAGGGRHTHRGWARRGQAARIPTWAASPTCRREPTPRRRCGQDPSHNLVRASVSQRAAVGQIGSGHPSVHAQDTQQQLSFFGQNSAPMSNFNGHQTGVPLNLASTMLSVPMMSPYRAAIEAANRSAATANGLPPQAGLTGLNQQLPPLPPAPAAAHAPANASAAAAAASASNPANLSLIHI